MGFVLRKRQIATPKFHTSWPKHKMNPTCELFSSRASPCSITGPSTVNCRDQHWAREVCCLRLACGLWFVAFVGSYTARVPTCTAPLISPDVPHLPGFPGAVDRPEFSLGSTHSRLPRGLPPRVRP